MTTDRFDRTQAPDDDHGHLPDPLALALVRALGRYQARRDMAVAGDAIREQEPDPRRNRPTVPTRSGIIDLYSVSMPATFLACSFGPATVFRGGRSSLPTYRP